MDIFQKLEKVLRKTFQEKNNKFFFVQLIFFLNILHAQIDQRFDLYDWEIMGQNKSINSMSEGYQYIYFATDANGILRYNKFSRKFEASLFLGQGIKSKKIEHVYFDNNTGILWIIGNSGLEFSNNKEGNWNTIQLSKLSINSLNNIKDLGSSKNFIWIKTSSRFIKLDLISGSFLGFFTYPDEENINWGDISFKNRFISKDFSFQDYLIEGGWLLGNDSAADNNGIFHDYNSFLMTENGFGWIGLSNGQLLYVDDFSKTITPKTVGIAVSVPLTVSVENDLWLGGINNTKVSGISSIDNSFSEINNFFETNYSGFFNADFYSSETINNEVWFGSDGKVVVYNKRNDFFRTLGYEKGIPSQRIEFIEHLDGKIYIASKNDLIVLDVKSKKIINSQISNLIKRNNLSINFLDVINDELYLSLNGRVYVFDKEENVNVEKFEFLVNDNFRVNGIYGNENSLFFSSEKGILSNGDNKFVPSSLYFNNKVNDIILINDNLYIGTSGGLAIYNLIEEQLNNFYDFSFIRNIFELEQVDEFLVLLTSTGLVKLRLSL
jgi:ligand-binding sensor domain-containing protein